MIKIKINNICAKLTECEPLTSGMIGKTLDVELSADWNNYEKTAVFSNGDITIDVLESQWSGNTITIPHEVLAVPNRTIVFGMYGFGVENGTVHALPTVYAKIGIPMVGADPESDPTTEPSLPVYAQLQWQIDHFEISDEQIAQQIQEYLETHPIGIEPATATKLGGIKVGEGLSVTADGTLSTEVTADDLDELAGIVDGKANAADIPSLDGYATENWVESKGYLTQHQSLAGYATESYVQNYHDNTKQDKLIAGDNITIAADGKTISATGGGISDAPSDGKQYARKDGEWTEVFSGSTLPMSPYLNKKIGFLGDSNTTPNPGHTNKKYDVWVADLTGCTRLNYGRDGTGFAENGTSYDSYTFAKRVSGIDAECDVVCVLGGINDVMRSTLGQFGDTTEATVYGGLEILCTNLKTRFPTADIVFITPPSATGLTGYNAYQVATAIKEVANQRGVHVFDFRQYINNPDFNDIHYTSVGHEILGRALADYLVRLKHYAGYNYIRTNNIPATSITLSENSISISGINTHTLAATVSPADTTDTVSWSSNDTGVATVVDGVVTSVGNGNCTITAVCGEQSATCTVTVSGIVIDVPVTGVTLNASSGEVEKDGTVTLTATVEPANATNKNVTWSTSDATKATVNNGVVTGVAAGSATITVTTVDGGFTATYAVTVTDSQEHDGEQVIPDFAAINYDFSQVTKKANAWYNGVANNYSQFQHTGYLGIKAGNYTLYTGAAIAANLFDTNFEYKRELNNGNASFRNNTFTIDYDGYIGVNLDCQNHSQDDWSQVSLVKNS